MKSKIKAENEKIKNYKKKLNNWKLSSQNVLKQILQRVLRF